MIASPLSKFPSYAYWSWNMTARVPRQTKSITDLRDTDKSRYFAITEFNNWFDHRVCFHIYFTLWEFREEICHFSSKSVVTITHEQNIICSKRILGDTTQGQPIICRHLFAGHVLGSRPMKKKKSELTIWLNYQSSLPSQVGVLPPHSSFAWHIL